MKEKIAALGCWKGPVVPETVRGGHSNYNFFVEDQGAPFFVRLGHDLDVHCVKRFNELAVARAAHAAGISPEIVWYEPGVMVTRFIRGKPLTKEEIGREDYLCRLVPLLQKCHRKLVCNIRGPVLSFWVFHVCRNYAALLGEGGDHQYPDLNRIIEINDFLEKAVGPIHPVVTHNDLLASNFIDDGTRIWIIDWEYAGFNTALFDIACFSSFCDLPASMEIQVLEMYYESKLTEELFRRFVALKCASELWTYLWSLVAEAHYALDLDYEKIADGHRVKFEKLWLDFKNI